MTIIPKKDRYGNIVYYCSNCYVNQKTCLCFGSAVQMALFIDYMREVLGKGPIPFAKLQRFSPGTKYEKKEKR